MTAAELETTVHGIVVQARHETCSVCGAAPECQCVGTPEHPEADDWPGCVHVCRPCRAAANHRITRADAASVIPGLDDVFAGWGLVLDTAAEATA